MEQLNAEAAARTRLRHRRIAVALTLAVAIGASAVYFTPLVFQYVEGPSAEEAIAAADERNGGEASYALEFEYPDENGSVVYRLTSKTDPVIHLEMRREFYWLPANVQEGALLPDFKSGPHYVIVNGDEYRKDLDEWRREHMRRGKGPRS